MAVRRKRNSTPNNTIEVNKDIDSTQNQAITLDVEEEVVTNVKEEVKEESTQISLDTDEISLVETQEEDSEEETIDLIDKEEKKEVVEEEVEDKKTTKNTTKKNTTKKSKKSKEAKTNEEPVNLEIGNNDIEEIEEYLKEDLCPTTENLEMIRQEIIDKINTFFLNDSMTPEENIKLSHQVTNYIIEIENLISEYNRRARFLKGIIDDETKLYGKGSNAEERKLNAFLRLINYAKKPEDKPVNLLIYLRVAEDMCEFLNLRLNALYRISDNLKSDKFFFEKLEREIKK